MSEENKEIKVLDDGFVRLVDYMGDDSSIVQAARISYGAGTKKKREDRGLIRYLMRHRHTTPFEMVEFKFHVRVPMDCWRQWIRHRTASVNEYSTRYSEAIDSQQKTDPYRWRSQSKNNKQGSDTKPVKWPEASYTDVRNYLSAGDWLTQKENELHDKARATYEERLRFGVAREQARKDLPLSTYTEAYWKCDLHNIFHFLGLRLDSHAQYEIREFAKAIEKLIEPIVPISYEAFKDYRLNSIQLSKQEQKILGSLLIDCSTIEETIRDSTLSKREQTELIEKIRKMNK